MAASLWPWLAIAAAGALHGLNPACGWALLACNAHGRSRGRALLPIALGHAASLALVAGPAILGLALDRGVVLWTAAGLLAALLLVRLAHRGAHRLALPAGPAGLALWSFLVTGTHGAGLVLVPALLPFCGDAAAHGLAAPGPLALLLAAVALHLAAMLAVTAALAAGVGRGLDRLRRAWTAVPERHNGPRDASPPPDRGPRQLAGSRPAGPG